MTDDYDLRPIDTDESRYENSKEDFEVNPLLSCSNTDFGGDDPAIDPTPSGETPAELATMVPPEEIAVEENTKWEAI